MKFNLICWSLCHHMEGAVFAVGLGAAGTTDREWSLSFTSGRLFGINPNGKAVSRSWSSRIVASRGNRLGVLQR